jgi:hypothetical protein
MKQILLLEEVAQCLLPLLLLYYINDVHISWWLWIILFFSPDIGMLGYLINPKIGAISYNIFHHKAIAILLFVMGFFIDNRINDYLAIAGLLLYAHASFDRVFGYGLKHTDSFKNTHLGKLK